MVLGKNNWLKRIVAFVLAVLMTFTAIPFGTNVMKADEENTGENTGEDTGGDTGEDPITSLMYTFNVYEMVDETTTLPINDALITIFPVGNDGYDVSNLEGVKTAGKVADVDGQYQVTFEGEEIATAKGLAYAITYTKTETDAETGEPISTTVYAVVRGTLGEESVIDVPMKAAKGITGTICIGTEDVPATESFDLALKNEAGEVVAYTRSNTAGVYVFDDIAHVESATYYVEVDSRAYTFDSCKLDVINFTGEVGLVEQTPLVLIEKTLVPSLSFPVTDMVLIKGEGNAENCLAYTVEDSEIESVKVFYRSSDTSVAMVDESTGVVTAVGVGTATITATFNSDNYKTTEASYTVTVPGVKFSGTVKDAGENPLNAALYIVETSAEENGVEATNGEESLSGALASVQTVDGAYTIEYAFATDTFDESTNSKSYDLIVNCDGYLSQTQTVQVAKNTAYVATQDFRLSKPTYTVGGTVAASDSQSMNGETVYLLKGTIENLSDINLATNAFKTATVSEDGTFTFGVIEAGDYTIVMDLENYQDCIKPITVSDADISENLTLTAKELITVEFESENLELLTNAGTADLNIKNDLVIKNGETKLTEEELQNVTVSYTVDSDSVITMDVPGVITGIKNLGQAAITVNVSSDVYRVDTEHSKLSYTVDVYTFAFVTDELNTAEKVVKTFGAEDFSTKAVLIGADDEIKEVEVSYASTDATQEIVKIIYVDENGEEVVDDSTAVKDVKVQILAASNPETPVTISAAYKNTTIQYAFEVQKISTLDGFAWQGFAGTEATDGVNYVYGGEVKQINVPEIQGIEVKYTSSNADIVAVDAQTGEIKLKGVTGDVPVVITAAVVTANYDIDPITYKIYVAPAQMDLVWNATALGALEQNDKYSVTKPDGNLNIEVSYEKLLGGSNLEFALPVQNTVEDGMTYEYKVVDENAENQNVAQIDENAENPNVAQIDENGKVTILGVGTVTIQCTATHEKGYYESKTISYTLVVNQGTQTGFGWNATELQALRDNTKYTVTEENGILEKITVPYVENLEFVLSGLNTVEADMGYTYKLIYDENAENKNVAEIVDGKVKLLSVGEVTIQCTSAHASNYYTAQTIEYTLVVTTGTQTGFDWNETELQALSNNGYQITTDDNSGKLISISVPYVNEMEFLLSAQNTVESGMTYTYSVECVENEENGENGENEQNTNWVEVTDGTVKVNGIGTVKIQCTSTHESSYYEPKTIEYTLVVTPGTQDEFEWKEEDISTIKGLENPKYTVSTDEVTKELISIGVTYKKGITALPFTLGVSNDSKMTNISYEYKVIGNPTDRNVATVDQNGIVKIYSAGTVTIQCTSTHANGYFDPKTISYTLVVNPAQQSISWKPINWINPSDLGITLNGNDLTVEYRKGLVYQLNPFNEIQDDELKWKFSMNDKDGNSVFKKDGISVYLTKEDENDFLKNEVATLYPNGQVAIHEVGEVYIVYTSELENKYKPLSIEHHLIVTPGTQPLKWNADDIADLNKITNRPLESLPEKGGTIYITYDELNKKTYQLDVDGENDDLTYSFKVTGGDASIITLGENNDGTVTINGIGTVTITYKAEDADSNYEQKELSYTLVVEPNPQAGVKWKETKLPEQVKVEQEFTDTTGAVSLIYDETFTSFKIGAVEPVKSNELAGGVFTSSNENVAKVAQDGTVTILKEGTTIIRYKSEAITNNYLTKELSYTIKVNKNSQAGLKWDPKNLPKQLQVEQKFTETKGAVSLIYDENFTSFKIGITGQIVSDELAYGFTSSNPNVATVTADGTVTIQNAGTTTITYESKDKTGNYVTKTLSYTITVKKNEQVDLKWNKEGFKQSGESIVLTYLDAPFKIGITGQIESNELNYGFTSSNPNVATVTSDGMVTIQNAGTTVIRYTSTDTTGNYVTKELSYTFTVKPNPQADLNWNKDGFAQTGESIVLTYLDAPFKIGITGQIPSTELNYGFTSSDENVATVAADGTVTIQNAGTTTITYTSKDTTGNYVTKVFSYTFTVKPNPQASLNWDKAGFAQTGEKLTFIYEAAPFKIGMTGQIPSSELNYGFVSGDEDVLKVSADGTVTIQNTGTTTITYKSVDTTGNFITKEFSYTVTVHKAEQSGFAWQNGPADGHVVLTYDKNNPKFTLPTTVPKEADQANLTYRIVEGDAASIDAKTGEVTMHKHGTVVIEASIIPTRNYKANAIRYTLTILKDEQSIHFSQETYSFINGGAFASPVVIEDEEEAIGTVLYEIVEDENGVLYGIDPNTGALNFTLQPGTVVIKATKAEDDRYNGTEASYTLTVKEWDPLASDASDKYYAFSGVKADDTVAWFTKADANHPVRLVASEGYQLYKGTTDPIPGTAWTSYIEVSDIHEGTDNAIVYYIREIATGYVSKQYALNNIHVDTVSPDAAITIDKANIWEKILSLFTFHLFGQDQHELILSFGDETSGVKAVYYYISSHLEPLEKGGVLDVTALEKEAEWTSYSNVVNLMDENMAENVIYAKVVDYAGNVTYSNTNGLIFDGVKPTVTPTIVTQDINGLYNGNVEINLDVVDPEPYSGIQQITYKVENAGEVTDQGILFTFQPAEEGNPKKSELVSKWNSASDAKNIIVNAQDNNSDNVKVTFTVTDNVGNTTETYVDLKIDITAPTIDVQYNNNEGDTTFADSVYYNTDRTAVITVKERHFDPSKVVVTITNTDGVIPGLSEWTKVTEGTGNGDDTTYRATVLFTADGDYTFDISCTDNADNANVPVNYGNSQAPNAFTMDKVLPTISVSYSNDNALNENYFKEDRTATIVIQEHNFDASRVNAIITATDNGETTGAPTISGWSTSGDTHTATISYSSDALYTFDIEYTDKAGNVMVDFAPQTFYVDKTPPTLSIENIVDLSPYNEETIGFIIRATDTNFDVFTPVITVVYQTETGFATKTLEGGAISEIANGQIFTIENLETDGIYSIKCTVVDKAGNAYTEVLLQREDGTTYTEPRAGEDTLMMFYVNRNGSVFAPNENTQNVLNKYYIQNVENDIVVDEINTNELTVYSVSLNGETLEEGSDYSVSKTGGTEEWKKYTYTINKNLFEGEGEYVLVISSTDAAENNAFSDVKNANLSFVVDRTAPVVTVTGIESDRSYQAEDREVTVMPTDDGGMVERLIIRYVDREGKILEDKDPIINLSGEELREQLEANNGTISFTLGEGLNQNIQIICSDASENADGQTNTSDQIYKNISISPSAVAIFFAGDALLYIGGGVAATGAVAGGGAFFFRKRKSLKGIKKK